MVDNIDSSIYWLNLMTGCLIPLQSAGINASIPIDRIKMRCSRQLRSYSKNKVNSYLVWQASITSLIDFIAIDQFLLRERHKSSIFDSPPALDITGGREGPAASTTPLVLHRGDSICCTKIGHLN